MRKLDHQNKITLRKDNALKLKQNILMLAIKLKSVTSKPKFSVKGSERQHGGKTTLLLLLRLSYFSGVRGQFTGNNKQLINWLLSKFLLRNEMNNERVVAISRVSRPFKVAPNCLSLSKQSDIYSQLALSFKCSLIIYKQLTKVLNSLIKGYFL